MKPPTVGQTVYALVERRSAPAELFQIVVSRVGRKYFYVNAGTRSLRAGDEFRFDISTGRDESIDRPFFHSAYTMAFESPAAYEAWKVAEAECEERNHLENKLSYDLTYGGMLKYLTLTELKTIKAMLDAHNTQPK